MSLTIIGILEHIRCKFNKRITIIRGYVCEEEARALFGNSKDYHHLGKSVLFSIEEIPFAEVYQELESMPEITGLGYIPLENAFQVDIRDKDRELWVEEHKEKITLSNMKRTQYNLLPPVEVRPVEIVPESAVAI